MSSTTGREPVPRRPWSLAARLTALYAASAFVLVAGATGFLYWTLAAHMDQEDDQRLADKIHVLRTILRRGSAMIDTLRPEVEPHAGAGPYARFLLRIAEHGGPTLLETPGMREELPPAIFPAPAGSAAEPPQATEVTSPTGRCYRLMAAFADANQPSTSLLLQVALDCTEEERLMAGYRRNVGLVLVLALAVSTFLGYLAARHGLQPVAAISATAQRIGSETLHQRLAIVGLPAELQQLARAFNEMLDRLEAAFARLGQFSSDIAHELRTPVNSLRSEAEIALHRARTPEEYREALVSCQEEGARLTSLIENMLFLARAEHPEARLQRERVNVSQELVAIREFYEAAAVEAGVTLTLAASAPWWFELDRTLLQRAVGNLIANALAHTPKGGAIKLAAGVTDGVLRVTVADTGPGIAAEHLPHIFDRFYRVDQARTPGAGQVGLGLAIVKSIMALHRGEVEVRSAPGQGAVFTLVFPP